MITVDILSPGGLFTAANGNTQELTTTFTTSIGSPTLTCNGASPFVTGDTGKYFQIEGPGSGGNSGTLLEGTLTFVSSTVVTMSVNATKALATASAYMIWGNDDSAGMRAFNTWAQTAGDSITLTLGTGAKNFIFYSSDSGNAIRSGGFTWNIPNPVTIVGNGPSSTKFFFTSIDKSSAFCAPNMSKSGNSRWGVSSIFTAKTDSVSAGSTTLQCKTIADAALFTANTWARIAGLDMQATGDPPNNFFYEYVYMTNVNTTTGVITLQTGLQNAYLDTWPLYDGGAIASRSDKGGPATLYALDPGWNVQATFKDLSTNNPYGQSPSKCRDITFDNVTCLDTSGLFPSDSKTVTFQNCNFLSFSPMEVDKMVEECIIDNTDCNQLKFQSSINRVTIRNGSTVTSFNGTPRYLSIESGCTVNPGNTVVGVTSYGRADSFTVAGSTINGALTYGGYSDNGDGGTGTVPSAYTISNGLITMPRAGRTQNTASLWAVPGTRWFFNGRETTGGLRQIDWGPTFTVTAVTADATNIYVQTDCPYSSFPIWVRNIHVVPSTIVSLASDVTSSDPAVVQLKAATAAGYTRSGTYAYASLTGATCGVITSGAVYGSPLDTGGRLVSLKVNVTTPYTGDASALNWGKSTAFTLSADGSSLVTWDPRFDLRTTGLRTITPAGVTGAVGADSLSSPVTNAWLTDWMGDMLSSRDIRSVYNGNNALGPVFTAELIVDQGAILPTAVVPLRLRLRA